MLTVVFLRMEADSATVPLPPIVVSQLQLTDDLSSPAMKFVEGFMNKVRLKTLSLSLSPSAVSAPWVCCCPLCRCNSALDQTTVGAYSADKVANRNPRVWHGATENEP
jgi:hypothetical protein